mgnify:CR=1 FL=1
MVGERRLHPAVGADVARVGAVDRRVQGGRDRRGEGIVHLGHEQRKDVGRVGAPLLAGALAETVKRLGVDGHPSTLPGPSDKRQVGRVEGGP